MLPIPEIGFECPNLKRRMFAEDGTTITLNSFFCYGCRRPT